MNVTETKILVIIFMVLEKPDIKRKHMGNPVF
jgi:hypothetical protein